MVPIGILKSARGRPGGATVTLAGEAVPRALVAGRYSIGADLDSDVLVPDLAEGEAAVLVVREEGAVEVEALADGFRVGEAPIAAGASRAMAPGEWLEAPGGRRVLALRSTSLGARFASLVRAGARPGADAPRVPGRPPPAAAAPPADRSPPGLLGWALASSLVLAGIGLMVLGPAVVADAPAPDARAAAVSDAAASLRLRLADADLADRVTLTPGPLGLDASGRLDPEGLARWRDVRATAPAAHRVADEVVASDARAEVLIVAAATLPRAFVVGLDGRAYDVGRTLPGGWTVISVGADAAVLEREGERRAVRY